MAQTEVDPGRAGHDAVIAPWLTLRFRRASVERVPHGGVQIIDDVVTNLGCPRHDIALSVPDRDGTQLSCPGRV